MQVVLKRSVNQVKNGYLARAPQLRLTAYGPSAELASKNLEYLVAHYLRPFERGGSLERELAAAGVEKREGEAPLTILLLD